MGRWKLIDKGGEQAFESENAVLDYIKRQLSAALENSPIADVVVIDPDGTRCDVHIHIRLDDQDTPD